MRHSLILLALITLAASGCEGWTEDEWTQKRKPVVPVKGIVIYQGVPLSGAKVILHSTTEKLSAYSSTNELGEFILTTYEDQDGAVPGDAVLTVTKMETQETPHPEDPNLGPIEVQEIWHTPKVYADPQTSPLKVTIPAGGTNNLLVELKQE